MIIKEIKKLPEEASLLSEVAYYTKEVAGRAWDNKTGTGEFIAEQVPEDLSEFDFVFIDSVSKAGMEISDITALHKKFPRTAFIFIYHSTKEGKFRGGNEHAHEVDVIIEVVNGEASAVGRFN